MSAIRRPMSIAKEPATKTPVVPRIPDDNYASAFTGSPLAKRHKANPAPVNAPKRVYSSPQLYPQPLVSLVLKGHRFLPLKRLDSQELCIHAC